MPAIDRLKFSRILTLLLLCSAYQPAWSGTYPEPSRFQSAIDDFLVMDRQSDLGENQVVATGSSSMRFWSTISQDLAPLNIVHRGFGGSNMNDLLFYLDELVIKHNPVSVMIYEGDNDVALGATPVEILGLLETILQRIDSALPSTTVYLLYVKPSPSRWELWPAMQEVNAGFQSICDRSSVIACIDVATPMLNAQGEPMREIFLEDDLHMNDKGYRIWTKAVRAVLFPEPTKE